MSSDLDDGSDFNSDDLLDIDTHNDIVSELTQSPEIGKDIASLLTPSLSSLTTSPLCFRSLCTGLAKLSTNPHFQSKHRSEPKFVAFIDTIIHLISKVTTFKEMFNARVQMDLCRCFTLSESATKKKYGSDFFIMAPFIHTLDPGIPDPDQPRIYRLPLLFVRIFTIICDVLHKLPLSGTSQRSSWKPTLPGHGNTWPTDSASLLPYGPVPLIESLLSWNNVINEQTTEPWTAYYLTLLLQITPQPPQLAASLCVPENKINGELRMWIRDRFISFVEKFIQTKDDNIGDDEEFNQWSHILTFLPHQHFLLLDDALSASTSPGSTKFTFSPPCTALTFYKAVILLIDAAYPKFENSPWNTLEAFVEMRGIKESLCRYTLDASRFYVAIPPDHRQRPSEANRRCQEQIFKMTSRIAGNVAEKLLYFMAYSPSCSNPSCPADAEHRRKQQAAGHVLPGTEELDKSKVFKMCTGCKVMRYCSKECQRHAWSRLRPGAKHKEFCNKLDQVWKLKKEVEKGKSVATGSDDRKMTFAQQYEKEINRRGLDKVTWELVEHFEMLMVIEDEED